MKIFYLIIIFNFFLYTLAENNYSKASIINQSKINFDRSLEKIEQGIINQDKKMVCIESKDSIKLINKNQIQLKRVEPYYDWNEIKKVLLLNVNKYCQGKAQSD
tara:strand:+ start:207 stop:518 length:312 start_codon:yes stop_codon:yes gene_type:complete